MRAFFVGAMAHSRSMKRLSHARSALIAALALAVVPQEGASTHISITGQDPALWLNVGTFTQGVVDTVAFAVPAGAIGSGTPVQSSNIILVEVAYKRASPTNAANVVLSANSSQPFTNAGTGAVFPFADAGGPQISWSSAAPAGKAACPITLPGGSFNGSASQQITTLSATATGQTYCANANFTFSYANRVVIGGGTWTGRVTFTAATI